MYKHKRESDKFIWEGDSIILEYSNPKIQAFTSYTKIDSIKDIMYYYYDVKLYKKKKLYIDTIKEELISEVSTYDFPTINQFYYMINEVLNIDLNDKNSQKIEYRDKLYEYSYTTYTSGFSCDDFYRINKVKNIKNDIYYNLYIGCSIDETINSEGVNIFYINDNDMIELQKCVKEFIKYSINEYNKETENSKKVYKIKDGNIYKYDNNLLTDIIQVGDIVDLYNVVNNKETYYYNAVIKEIKDNNITIITYNGEEVINIENIPDMFKNVPDYKLKYNEMEISQDFINLINEEIMNEFKTLDREYLFDKYSKLIIDLTWMCREEHEYIGNYNIDNSLDPVDRMRNVVLVVIDNIKDIINRRLLNGKLN